MAEINQINMFPRNPKHRVWGILLALILLALGMWIYKSVSSIAPLPENSTTQSGNESVTGLPQGIVLAVTPTVQTNFMNELSVVDITLNTDNREVDGVDIFYLRFDPAILEVVDADSSMAGVQVKPGNLFPTTVTNQVDNKNGTIVLSQVTNGGQTFKGGGVVATITFKGKVLGTSELNFDFTPDSSHDTNVSANARDALGTVKNAIITYE